MQKFRKRKNEAGFSLVEVLIAVVILAIAGATLLKLLQGTSLFNRTLTSKTVAYVALNKAAAQVNASPFLPCSQSGQTNFNYYSKDLPDGINVDSILALDPEITGSNKWVNCSEWSHEYKPIIQKITLKATFKVKKSISSPGDGNTKYIFRSIIKTSAGKYSSAKILPNVNSITLLRVSSSDSRFNTENNKTVSLGVSPYNCRDVFMWNSASSGDLAITVNPDCTATISAVRDAALIPWPSTGSVVFSAVDLSSKSLLYEATINVTINLPAPIITSFSVTTPTGGNNCVVACLQSGLAGNQITIIGKYLLGNPDGASYPPNVNFAGPKSATVEAANDSTVIVTVPTGVTNGPISLQTQGGSDTSSQNFTLIPKVYFDETHSWTDPDTSVVITNSFEPQGASPRLSITVYTTGNANFISNVLFSNNVSAAGITYLNSNSVSVVVPTGAVRGPLTIVTAAGSSVSVNDFFPVPKITSVKTNDATVVSYMPSGGYGSGITGRSIQIVGSGLSSISKVQFTGANGWIDASNCGYTGNNPKSDTFYYLDKVNILRQDARVATCVPEGAVAGPIRAFNDIGEGVSPWNFHPEPVIGSLSVVGAGLGIPVTINGSGFTNFNRIAFGGITAGTPTASSDTTLTVNVPTGALDGPITVRTPVDVASSNNFYVKPRISNISPSSPKINDVITITGTGFTGFSGVTVNGISLTNTSVSGDTSISGKVACNASTGAVVITASLGTNPVQTNLSLGTLAPAITSYGSNNAGTDSLYKSSGTLKISGSDFGCVTGISWNGNTLGGFVSGTTSISASLPASATTAGLLKLVVNGNALNTTSFLWPTPVVSSLTQSPATQSGSIASSDVTSVKSGSNYIVTYKYSASQQLFVTGQPISVSGLSPSIFNVNNATITATGTVTAGSKYSFSVSVGSTNPGSSVSGSGTASAASAIRGTTQITLTGSGFAGCQSGTCPSGVSVSVGSYVVPSTSFTTFTDTSITFTLPSSTYITATGSTTIKVTTPYSTITYGTSIWVV